MTNKVVIRRLPTGVPGLDQVLRGGLPELSFNLIAGPPGSGKTTLAHQITFALATPDHPALYFTVLGEPSLKMLRYQQQFTFYDIEKVNESVRFVNLEEEARQGEFSRILKRIIEEVEAASPGVIVVDSFRSVVRATKGKESMFPLEGFVQELGMQLTGWEATTFLVGEYDPSESAENPVFTVADGIFCLQQAIDRNSMVRKLQVLKCRGQASIPGLHTFRITSDGLQVFPRMIISAERLRHASQNQEPRGARISTGVEGLDDMLDGGLPVGFSALVAGPSGSGKTILATQFVTEGARKGEPGVIAVFEKRPREYSQVVVRAFDGFVREGKIGLIHTRPLDLSIDETLHDLTAMVTRLEAKRVVIDSLSGFELALAPTFREDFRESLYRMIALLTNMGVTVLMTAELEDRYTDLPLSPHGTAFLSDAVIVQRYVEIEGRLRRVMAVVKVRGSIHSSELRVYEITDGGIVVGEVLGGYEGLLSGKAVAIPRGRGTAPKLPKRRRSRSR